MKLEAGRGEGKGPRDPANKSAEHLRQVGRLIPPQSSNMKDDHTFERTHQGLVNLQGP